MSCVPNGHEPRTVDRIGDVDRDRPHVGDVLITDEHQRGTTDLAETVTDGDAKNFLLLGACLPGALLHLVGAENHLGHRRPHSWVDLVR